MMGNAGKSVKLLLLDTRYFRDTLMASQDEHNRYSINHEGDILGATQWSWLEEELTKNEAQVHILCSGYQIIPWEHGFEKWSNFPKARKRLFEMIARINPNSTFLISGDRHIAEFSKVPVDGLPYPLYEFTSSGLTHTWDKDRVENNQHRIGNKIVKKNFGLIKIRWESETPSITYEVKGVNNELYATFKAKF